MNIDQFIDIEVEEIAGIIYTLMENERGVWVIQKLDESVPHKVEITFANITNNPTVLDTNTAWTAKETLTYADWDEIF